jgi:hypothetical protein
MIRILIVALVTWLLGSGVNLAQETGAEPPAEARQDTEASGAGDENSGEALPEIDVWAEEEADESDVFVPTESISADSSIAFPSDI